MLIPYLLKCTLRNVEAFFITWQFFCQTGAYLLCKKSNQMSPVTIQQLLKVIASLNIDNNLSGKETRCFQSYGCTFLPTTHALSCVDIFWKKSHIHLLSGNPCRKFSCYPLRYLNRAKLPVSAFESEYGINFRSCRPLRDTRSLHAHLYRGMLSKGKATSRETMPHIVIR